VVRLTEVTGTQSPTGYGAWRTVRRSSRRRLALTTGLTL
jgi:hypothetical protein